MGCKKSLFIFQTSSEQNIIYKLTSIIPNFSYLLSNIMIHLISTKMSPILRKRRENWKHEVKKNYDLDPCMVHLLLRVLCGTIQGGIFEGLILQLINNNIYYLLSQTLVFSICFALIIRHSTDVVVILENHFDHVFSVLLFQVTRNLYKQIISKLSPQPSFSFLIIHYIHINSFNM